MNRSLHPTNVTDLEELGLFRNRRSDAAEVMASPEARLSSLARFPYISDDNRSEHIGQIRGFLGGISVTDYRQQG